MSALRRLGSVALLIAPIVLGGSAQAVPARTFVTGETATNDVIFDVNFETAVPYSAIWSIALTDPRMLSLDGIDFVPGTGNKVVVVGMPAGKLGLFDVAGGVVLPDLIPNTDLIAAAAPPPTPGSHPSTVLSSPNHVYYVENQFGLGFTSDHRIMRKPFAGGPEELVFDGVAVAPIFGGAVLKNLEGLEHVTIAGNERLYFFAQDPSAAPDRALVSIGITPVGLWDGLPPVMELVGLTGTGNEGSDELDFDPVWGLLFGTNLATGEVIAYNPFVGAPAVPPATPFPFFIDPARVAAGAPDGLGLLGMNVDGIRSDGAGRVVFAGRGGVIGAIDVGTVLAFGATDVDVYPLLLDPNLGFDDLTPLPEPSGALLPCLAALALLARRPRRRA